MEAVVVVAALPLTFAVLWALLRTSIDSRLVAVPSGQRWHTRETPTFGGIGIFAGFAAGVLAALASGAIDWSGELGGILGGIALVFVAGLVDDVWRLNVLAKLGAQIAGAILVLASGLEVHIVGNRRWNRRGAMVTDRYQHIHHHPTVTALADHLHEHEVLLFGIDNLPGSLHLETQELPRRVCLLFGQEGPGLSDAARAACDGTFSIAQFGSTRSINASAAAAIAMHTWIRQHADLSHEENWRG